MLVILADKHTENVPSLHSQRSSHTRCPCEDSFAVGNDEGITKRKWTPGPQTSRRECFCTISPVPSRIDLYPPPRSPSNGHFTPLLEKSDYPADEGWQWQAEILIWADHHHVLSPMGLKHFLLLD
ncbi:hypothetical protein O181_007449 [Austropuccinia psidii MF-1]|uniref:Uncharacterized protein n=1 Tax=Austropuccinia psidii MF-1 TaxID=1389203 RepID=A0A9Q3BLZ6_9BASI|nr:hypothetical protein [Austropuccinia psidii MF-1]